MIATSKTFVAGAARVSTPTQRSMASVRAPCRVSIVTRASNDDNQGPSTSKALSLGLCGLLAAGSLAFASPSQANLSTLGNKIEQAAGNATDSINEKTNDPANAAKLAEFENKGSVVNDIKDKSADAVDAVKDAASNVADKAKNVKNDIKGAVREGKSNVDDAASNVANKAKNVKNDIKGAVREGKSNVDDAASNVANKAKNVKNDIKGAVRQGASNVDDTASNVADNVSKSGKGPVRGLFGRTKLSKDARKGEEKLGEAKENAKDAGRKGKELAGKAADNLK